MLKEYRILIVEDFPLMPSWRKWSLKDPYRTSEPWWWILKRDYIKGHRNFYTGSDYIGL